MTLTDDELSARLMVASGWTRMASGGWQGPLMRMRWRLFKFATSMDALLAPGGPIELCRAKGHLWTVGYLGDEPFAQIDMYEQGVFATEIRVTAATPARALAECALACLEEQGQ